MTQRSQWRFRYDGAALAPYAREKADHHRAREGWWNDELTDAGDAVKAATAQFREQPITGGTRLEIVIDPTLTGRYNECSAKVREHRVAAEAFDRWEAVFRGNLDTRIELDAEDIAFFGIGDPKPEAESP